MPAQARLIGALVALVAACRGGGRADEGAPAERPEPGPDGLRAHLARVVAASPAARDAAIAAWPVPGAGWPALVTAPYRDHHAAYAARVDTSLAPIATLLAGGGRITTRVHYADDPALAPPARRERLALPVGRPGVIASIRGVDLPAVFAFDGAAWRALAGVDALTIDVIAGFDPACAAAYAATSAPGHCMDASAPVAVHALAGAAAEVAIACRRLRALHAAGCAATVDAADRDSVAAPPP